MELIELKANIRTKVGNGPARALRREGKLPAVLYGPETSSILLSVGISDVEAALKKGMIGQVVLSLVIQNGETMTRPVMIKELQIHPVSKDYLHVDFYEINMDRKIRTKVPVVTKGKAKGIEVGGLLQVVRRELEVFCLPMEVPEVIEIDVTELEIGDSIHVNEISLKGNIEISSEVNFTIVTVLSPTKVEEEVIEEEELEEGEAPEEEAEDEEESS
ncbi:MAG: 50S ribosomal protein L25/general stress protein Ctc [Deltaproteobacteria bacterium]|nr:50S ribosomal protein L25/general stress protein Ctc [Deltaproteobacteria bacterium]MBW2199810.1 50S ribosomal protein L25/general stress protein Ctc [Deltaproteobacteria bacterium]MBW2537994.1 50S ribosomal protein L25/general stress protein Ctc [Deltaproteobacteria bacterium]